MENFLNKTPTQQKAYALAFVLTVKQVLADDRTIKGDSKAQASGMLDLIMKAIKEPSTDYMNLYVGLLFVMAFIGYFLYSNFGGNPKLHAEQLLLSDVVASTEQNNSSDFHKALDQAGPFARDTNGTLTKDSTLKLRRMITERAYLDFRDRREELMGERIVFLRSNDQQ